MTQEQKCWKMIEDAMWTFDHDYERISHNWSELSKKEFKMLETFVENKASSLFEKYEAAWLGQDGGKGINASDDSWSDLIFEVVGRGERFYDAITADKLREMADNDDYVESFHYCLQIED